MCLLCVGCERDQGTPNRDSIRIIFFPLNFLCVTISNKHAVAALFAANKQVPRVVVQCIHLELYISFISANCRSITNRSSSSISQCFPSKCNLFRFKRNIRKQYGDSIFGYHQFQCIDTVNCIQH